MVKLEKDVALKISSAFGGGIGRLREVCGVISGIAFVIGSVYGFSDLDDADAKTNLYKIIQELANKFKQKNKSIICRELIGEEGKPISYIPATRTKEYYETRPCSFFCGEAAEILENYLKQNKII